MNKQFTKILISISLAIISLAFAQQEITTVAELERLAPLGGEYRLAAGTYELSEPLLLTKGLTLLGAGIGKTIVTSSSPLYLISIEGNDSFKLDGISFEYKGSEGSEVLQIEDASFEISNSSFSGGVFAKIEDSWYGDGLWVHGNAKGTVSNSIISNNALNAIALEDRAILTISDSQVTNNGIDKNGSAIYATNDSEIVLLSNIINNHHYGSFFIVGNAKVTANSNTITNSGEVYEAIIAQENTELTLTENIIKDNPLGAISLFNKARAVVSSNELTNNGNSEYSSIFTGDQSSLELINNNIYSDWGLWFSVDSKVVAKRNIIDNSKATDFAAVTITDNANLDLSKNEIRNGAEWAVYATDNSQVVLSQNTIEDNFGGVIADANAKLRLVVNKIRNNQGHGVRLSEDSSAYISANTITKNRSGIVLFNQARADIIANNLSENNRTGLGVLDTAGADISNNKILSNLRNGLVVGDNAKPLISKNQIMNNILRGILFTEQAGGQISGNTISGSKWGIYITEEAKPEIAENIFEDNEINSFTGPLTDE